MEHYVISKEMTVLQSASTGSNSGQPAGGFEADECFNVYKWFIPVVFTVTFNKTR